VNIEVFTPTPRASVMRATTVNPGLLINWRTAYLRSANMLVEGEWRFVDA
jgi:hypothetical protein